MRAITRHIPRKYRTVIIRVAIGLACFALLCLLTSNKQVATTGPGRSDEALVRFDYDSDAPKDDLDDLGENDHEQAVAPIQHRLDGKDILDEEEQKKGFDEEPLLSSTVHEYFTDEELKPWFEKPSPDSSSPGELGKPVRITDTSEDTKRKIKEGWDQHAFNRYVCDQISLHRTIEDKRDRECKERKWRKPLPTTSVIIIFHNEAWCTLLRTVHSVLETSPKVALEEIILVDDASTFEHLLQKLDDYVKPLKVVKILRLPERSGLIRARLAGAEAATGNVLTFLDSHCECAPHWLEPLLERIAEDPTRVVCPVIEVINSDNFAMSLTPARGVQKGILTWNLGFNWSPQNIPRGQKIVNDRVVLSPTMAGGLFAMSKTYFNYLGTYDKNMLVWGGENIEMSLRIWTCGGSLEIHPCSHVGHVFRKRAPYSHPGGSDVIVRNSKRVAEVWLDEYKAQYYKRVPRARTLDAGDMSERNKLREDLRCHSFKWYLTNIYPDLYAPPREDILKSGEWHNEARDGKYCMDSGNPDGKPDIKIGMYACHRMGGNQDFEYTRQGEIRHNFVSELCLRPSGDSIVTVACLYPKDPVPSEQKWVITASGQLRHLASSRCMEAEDKDIFLKPCNEVSNQKWIIKDLSTR